MRWESDNETHTRRKWTLRGVHKVYEQDDISAAPDTSGRELYEIEVLNALPKKASAAHGERSNPNQGWSFVAEFPIAMRHFELRQDYTDSLGRQLEIIMEADAPGVEPKLDNRQWAQLKPELARWLGLTIYNEKLSRRPNAKRTTGPITTHRLVLPLPPAC